MAISVTSSLILLVALVAGIHGNPMDRRRQVCGFVAMSCGNQFQTVAQEMQVSDGEPNIGHICEIAYQARSCMGGCMDVIMDNPMMARALDSVLNYVCDESRREEMTQVASAQCFRDGSIENNFKDESNECLQTRMSSRVNAVLQSSFRRGIYDVEEILCPLVHDVMDCIDEKVEEMCGATVVPFVNEIFTIVLREMLSEEMPSCFDQASGAHSVVKRAIDYIKMLRK